MAGMGPPPKPDGQRRRRNASIAMTRLPAEGRKGRAPAWPLPADVVMTAKRDTVKSEVARLLCLLDDEDTPAAARAAANRRLGPLQERLAVLEAQLREQRRLERAVWSAVWKTPQAVQWERLGWDRDVATYVRHRVLGELGILDEAKEARQWSDRLGLNPQAMLRLRWEIAADEVAQKREDRAVVDPKPSPTARSRMRVVDPSAVARG